MTRRTTPLVAIAVAAVTVLIFVAAVRSPGRRSSHRAGSAEASRSDVRVARTALGRILVDARGHTLYLFRDDQDGESACTATCTRVWPPAIVTHAPRAGVGIEAAKLTTTRRANNTRQLVYNGHPLYEIVADTRPGQTQGQGFLGKWFVVSPAGRQIGHAGRSAAY